MTFRTRLTTEDYDRIKQLASEGVRMDVIGKQLSKPLTKQRVSQIIKKNGFVNPRDFRCAQSTKERDDAYFLKWGVYNKKETKTEIYRRMRERFRQKQANARLSGIEFTVRFSELVFPEKCPILGITLGYLNEGKAQENSPSFDRLDPSKGYIAGNVAVVSWRANRIKNDGTAEEHQRIADWIVLQKSNA